MKKLPDPPIPYKRKPWSHQQTALGLCLDKPVFALLMEQRTGKTKIVIDKTMWHSLRGDIDALFILAPNGVHSNWITDELPAHMNIPYDTFIWDSGTRAAGWVAEKREKLLTTKKLAVLSVNVEALRSDPCYKYCVRFLEQRRALMAVDESDVISTPGAKQTKRARFLGPRAKIRIIMTGTPSTESPFQLYSQFAFLDKDIIGAPTYEVFKKRYGEWEIEQTRGGRTYPVLIEYRDIDKLEKKIAPHVFRVRRDECADIPPKIYQKLYVNLTSEQRKAYNELREEYRLQLAEGATVTADHVLTRYLRLQQIASNYWPPRHDVAWHEACDGEGCEACEYIGVVEREIAMQIIDAKRNPRLDIVLETIKKEPGQVMIWARFTPDVELLMQGCSDNRISAVRYDGKISKASRDKNRDVYKAGKAKVLVANTAAIARGQDFRNASMMIYFSHYHSLRLRLQSEDRAESLTATKHTQILDVVARDTVDEIIIQSHRDKWDLSTMITKDPKREWI